MSTRSQRGRQVSSTRRSPLKLFYGIFGAIVLVGAGLLVFYAARGASGTSAGAVTSIKAPNAPVGTIGQGIAYTDAKGQQVTLPAGLYYKGKPDASVKVVAYEDFQCPGCGNFATVLEPSITKDYIETGKVQFIFHDFPLSQHANAPKAAEAARCAGDQGKFWQMHDLLYSRQTQWSDNGNAVTAFIGYAADLGLDRTAFQSCINDGKYTAAITEAGTAAQKAAVPATPTFIVNGQAVQSSGLRAALDTALKGAVK